MLLEDLHYKSISPISDEDIFHQIAKYDENKYCFGDYDYLEESEDGYNAAIYYNGVLLGLVGFDLYKTFILRREYSNVYIVVNKEYRHQNIATYSLKRIIKTIFDETKSKYVFTDIIISNTPSIELFKKLNFTRVFRVKDTFLANEIEYYQDRYNLDKEVYEETPIYKKVRKLDIF